MNDALIILPIDDNEYDFDFAPADDPDEPFDAPLFDVIDDDELADLLAPELPVVPAVVPPLHQGAPQQPEPENNNEADAAHFDNAAHEADILADDAPHEVPFDDDEEPSELYDRAQVPIPLDDEFDEGAPAFDDEFDEGAPAFDAGAPDQGAPNEVDEVFEQEWAAVNETHQIPYNLRPRGPTGSRNSTDAPFDGKSYHPPRQLLQTTRDRIKYIFGHVMTQMSAKAGIRKHGEAAEAALLTEFAQLEDLSMYQAVDPKSLTRAQKLAALRAINLIKEKRDGRLKGRTVADGRPQRTLYDKSETVSPTVSSDALILSILIDAYE